MNWRIGVTAGLALISGCVSPIPGDGGAGRVTGPLVTCRDPMAAAALSGRWLYEGRGYIYTLKLDSRGNGNFEWNDLQLMTRCLDGQSWRGRWIGPNMQSEGEFLVYLSKDLKVGEGNLRYTKVRDKPGRSTGRVAAA